MKKIALFAVAVAALVFAGCKKENNKLVADENGMVTVTFGGEKYVSRDKQAFYGIADQIYFTTGDKMYVNGGECFVNPKLNGGVTTETASNEADVLIPAEYVGYPAVALYPSHLFTPGTPITIGSPIDISDWTVEMKDDIDLIYPEAITGTYVTLNQGDYFQNWPLSAYIAELGGDDQPAKLQLKNNVALLTPVAKYGYNFVSALFAADPAFSGLTIDADNLPELRITNVVIASPDHKLTGEGHLEGVTTQAPYLVMDGTAPTAANPDKLYCTVYGSLGTEDGMVIAANAVYPTILGHVPVAPFANDGTEHLQVTAYFNMVVNGTTYYFKYTGREVEINQFYPIIRSERSSLSFDLFSPTAVTSGKISAASTTPLTVE